VCASPYSNLAGPPDTATHRRQEHHHFHPLAPSFYSPPSFPFSFLLFLSPFLFPSRAFPRDTISLGGPFVSTRVATRTMTSTTTTVTTMRPSSATSLQRTLVSPFRFLLVGNVVIISSLFSLTSAASSILFLPSYLSARQERNGNRTADVGEPAFIHYDRFFFPSFRASTPIEISADQGSHSQLVASR